MKYDQPTLKDLFRFIYKRQLIWYKRFILKKNPPWTNDEVLKKYKIINVYRELDKCTIYFLNKLKNIQDRKIILLNTVFFRFFNRVNLYEEIGIGLLDTMNQHKANIIIRKFDNIRKNGGIIFNNAYLISSGDKGQKKHKSVLNCLIELSKSIDQIIFRIDKSKTPEDSFRVLTELPMIGPFLACEFWTDLSYFHFFRKNWTDNDFVNIGPGAKWGLEILFHEKLTIQELSSKLNYLHKKQIEVLPKIHKKLNEKLSWKVVAYKKAFSNYPYLSLTNIEGSLCEFRKYWNISHGRGRKKYFKQSSYLNNLTQ